MDSDAAASSLSPAGAFGTIAELLEDLLTASASISCFASRWQTIRARLASLSSLLSEIADSPHWSENPLLLPILPELLSTLRRTETLCCLCCDASSVVVRGKLLMQSDLDMAAGWLSKQINELEILLRSGVLHQSTAIVLSRPEGSSSKDEVEFFVRDLFTRLRIGGMEFKRKALVSLVELLSEDDSFAAAVVATEGSLNCLISLLDLSSHQSIRESAVLAVSLLVSAGDTPRKCVFEEGALGPLLRMMECGSMYMKEKAAMAVEFITTDTDNAWAISAYGGVSILIQLCKTGSFTAQSHAAGAIRNISMVEGIPIALAEEGAIPVLMQLLMSGSSPAQSKSANCIAILASTSEHLRSLLVQHNGLQKLLHIFHECSGVDTLEHVLRAIYSISVSDASYRILSGSTMFILRLAELVQHGNVTLQHISASLLANLAISDGNKRAVVGCMGSLVKLMETSKPDGMQEVGTKALLSLLSVKSNRKEFVGDEKSLMRLIHMLDPKSEVVAKKYPVAVVAAIMAGGSHGCRKKLVSAGAYNHVQSLVEMDVAGARKALQRLSANRLTNILTRKWRD
ncbi:vacuolar protein 8-like [Andrographis paniculata]|uniref:vacuolar protein 8-like n=1 Tax=Andrographis paniculata TaxID=175694 RepID=UPI0021E86A70|nr:vacuolar protein 8-like [Andrographis paniculata]